MSPHVRTNKKTLRTRTTILPDSCAALNTVLSVHSKLSLWPSLKVGRNEANTSVINTDPIRVNSPSVLAKVGQLRVQEAAGEVSKVGKSTVDQRRPPSVHQRL